MAKGNLSFAVALNLLTTGFTKGANKANAALRSIQLQVRNLSMAFIAGAIGIGNFTSQVMASVKGMAKAQQTLKNVTGDSYNYSNALKFVYDQSKKYNQELIGLTANYARFYAAAKGSNMSLKDTQNVFEALTQSSTYFNLSADETSGVMLAVTQMMSKGKITAEELRGQLGERLPGAIGIMARALNITTAQLDDMMKKGKLAAAEVLPLFAQQLRIETMSFNPNSIEGSINKLRNKISEIFATDNVQKMMAGVINGITQAFEVISKNIKSIWAMMLAGLAGVVSNSFSTMFNGFYTKVNSAYSSYKLLQKEADKIHILTPYNGVDTSLDTKIEAYKNALANPYQPSFGDQDKIKQVDLLEKKYNALNKSVNGNIESYARLGESLETTSTSGGKLVKIIGVTGVNAFKKLGASLKSFLVSNWITIAIASITFLITKLVQVGQEWKRINNIVKDSQSNISNANASFSVDGYGYKQEEAKLQAIKEMYLDINTSIVKKKQLLEMLGVPSEKVQSYSNEQLKSEDLINEAIRGRLKLVKEEAILRAKASEYTRLLGEKERIKSEINKKGAGMTTLDLGVSLVAPMNPISNKIADIKLLQKELKEVDKALAMNENSFETAYKEVESRRLTDELKSKNNGDSDDLTSLQKYIKERKELENQFKNGALIQADFDDSMIKLNESFLKQIGSLDKLEEKYKKLFFTLLEENLLLEHLEIEIKDPDIKIDTEKFHDKLKNSISKELYIPIRPDKRDSTFDYKKSESQQLEEQLKIVEKLKEELQQAVDSGFSNYKAELEITIKGEKDLSKALKLAEVQEDIKNLQKEINEGTYSTIKDIAGSTERLVDAFKNVNEVLEDTDASGFEKVIAIINALIQTADSMMSVAKGIENITQLTNRFALAKQQEGIVSQKVATQKAAATGIEIAAESAGAMATATAASTEVVANTASAASSASADTAKIPFGWLAIPAVIASVIGMMSAIPKFANGGIVSGATIGMMGEYAGASSNPEVIAPLSKLKSLLKSDEKGGSSGNIVFKIQGTDLVGVLNNYNKKTSKVK